MRTEMMIPDLAPDLYNAVISLDQAIKMSSIDKSLLHLVNVRASQINGCSYCVDRHVHEALAGGVDTHKLHLSSAWRESSYFTPRERAALEWTESVTRLADTGVPDATYASVRGALSEAEIAQLTIAIGSINLLNRLAVSSRLQHPVRQRAVA